MWNSNRRQQRLVLIAAALVLASLNPVTAQPDFNNDTLVVETATGKHTFQVELAETPEQQTRGLMFRRRLDERNGMLFLHKNPRPLSMWMRNTYVSLDMIFIHKDGRVHRIEEHTEPLSERIINSGAKVSAVLEIAAGVSRKIGLKSGDLVRHRHFNNAH